MKQLSRVVWSEGMYLGPHHFQVQGRYFEDSIRFAASSLCFEPWGLAGCELDSEALINGTISVLHARGLFSDGLPFDMPQHDPLPAPRNIAEAFPMTRDRVPIYLTVPPRKENGLNCAPAEESASGGTRFVAENKSLFDETTGRDEKFVRLGRKNIKIALDLDNPDPAASVAIARVMIGLPDLIIADEPTSALDRVSGRVVVDQLKDLAMRAKCAVVLSTHDERIFDVATRRLHIEDGRCFEVPIHYH